MKTVLKPLRCNPKAWRGPHAESPRSPVLELVTVVVGSTNTSLCCVLSTARAHASSNPPPFGSGGAKHFFGEARGSFFAASPSFSRSGWVTVRVAETQWHYRWHAPRKGEAACVRALHFNPKNSFLNSHTTINHRD